MVNTCGLAVFDSRHFHHIVLISFLFFCAGRASARLVHYVELATPNRPGN